MKVIVPGHMYQLYNLDIKSPSDPICETIQFVQRKGDKYPGNRIQHAGTNLQEVLRVCIHRVRYLDSQRACWQDKVIHFLLCTCIWLLEQRAAKLHKRPTPNFYEAVLGDFCPRCGHVGCKGECHYVQNNHTDGR